MEKNALNTTWEPQIERGGSVTMDKIARRLRRIARKVKENQMNAVMFS